MLFLALVTSPFKMAFRLTGASFLSSLKERDDSFCFLFFFVVGSSTDSSARRRRCEPYHSTKSSSVISFPLKLVSYSCCAIAEKSLSFIFFFRIFFLKIFFFEIEEKNQTKKKLKSITL